MLVAEHRRAKVVGQAAKARQIVGPNQDQAMERLKGRVRLKSAENSALAEVMTPETLEDRFRALENDDKIEVLLQEIKGRHALTDGQ